MKYNQNKGSATIEATLILPIFLFAVLILFYSIRVHMAEAVLYEAAAETVEYMAELSYITECNYLVPRGKIGEYIDNENIVDSHIIGGLEGVNFYGSRYLDEDGYVCLVVNYKVGINVPLIGNLSSDRTYEIRQKAYVGDKARAEGEELGDDDVYVYITDNREAYHLTRSCSHLDLSLSPTTIEKAREGQYTPCEFCGDTAKDIVLITKQGGRYHGVVSCIGIKRNVYRVKKSQVDGLEACERCGS